MFHYLVGKDPEIDKTAYFLYQVKHFANMTFSGTNKVIIPFSLLISAGYSIQMY